MSTLPTLPPDPATPQPEGLAALLWGRVRGAAGLVRLRPFDTATAEGRSQERYRRAILTFLASAVARVVSFGTLFIMTRLTVGYLGAERYGVWMTITSLALTFLVFADLGLGNGMLNAIAKAHGQDDEEASREIVSSAFFMLLAVAILLAGATFLIYPNVDWAGLLRAQSPAAQAEAGPALLAFVLCFLINIPLGIVSRVQSGFQGGYTANLWSIAGSLLALGCAIAAIHARAGLPTLVLAVSGAPILATIGNGISLFWRDRPRLRPQWTRARRATAEMIFRLGFLFFLLQITSAVAYQTDNLVVTRIFGPETVTTYSVPMQIFTAIPVFVLLMLMPLWPAYGEALSRGDVGWVKATLRRSLILSLLVSIAVAAPLVVFGRQIIHWWVGPSVNPPISMLLGMAVLAVVLCGGNAVAVFLNGVGWVRFQLILGVIVAVAALVLKIVLAKAFGPSGIAWATVIGWLVPSSIAYGIVLPRRLAHLRAAPSNPLS